MEESDQLQTLAALALWKRPGTHWTGSCVCPKAGGGEEKPCLCQQ